MIDKAENNNILPLWAQRLQRFGDAGVALLAHDWAGTPLGPLDRWPLALAALTEATLASPLAAALACGPRRSLICNGPMARLIGGAGAPVAGRDAVEAFSRLWPQAGAAFARAAEGENVRAEAQEFTAADGGPALFDVSLTPLHGAGDGVACIQAQIVATGTQVLRDGEDLDGLPLLAWRSAVDGEWVWTSRRWSAHTGLSEAESLGFGWLQALHPEDRVRTEELWLQAQHSGALECDHRLYDRRRDAYEWRRTRASAMTNGEGEDVEWLGVSTRIDDLCAARDKQGAALAESRRRIRNTLGILRSIARRTAETSDSVESYAMHFEGRLDALARVGGLIGGLPPAAPLDVLVAEELMSFKVREDARFEISGPPLRLKPEAAEMIGLAVHELAVNALKFGALSPDGGRLEIGWRLAPETGALAISWRESGVKPAGEPPRANGFGLDLLKRGLAYALNARTEFDLRPDGLVCALEFPADVVV